MGRLEQILQALQQSWRRLVILLVISISVIVGVYLLLRPKPLPTGGSIFVSDIVATNTQQPTTLKGGVAFFTGSNEAIVATPQTKAVSNALLSEVAYENPTIAQYDSSSDSLVVSVEYTGTSPFFSLSNLKPGVYWLLYTKGSKPKVINPGLNQTISAYANQGFVYGLTVENDNTYNLYRYTISEGSSQILIKNIVANRIVGATKDAVITQDSKGVVYIYNNSGDEVSKIDRPGTIVFDNISNQLVTINNDVSRKSYKLTVYDAKGVKLRSRTTPYRYLFVSGGYIFATDQKIRPANIAIYTQASLEGQQHSLDMSKNPSQDALTGVVVVQQNPLIIGLVGSSNSLSLASENKSYIASLSAFQYPYFTTNQVGGTLIITSNGTSDVTLQTNDITNLDMSVNDLKSACGCDVNQLNKQWQIKPTEEIYE